MKKLFIYIILSVIFSMTALSQGFDWQYSSRMPYKIPKLFIGAGYNYNLISNTGDFSFLEDHIPCCNYKNGNGSSQEIALKGEYWTDGLLAWIGGIDYSYSISKFFTQITVDRSDGLNDYKAVYEYSLANTHSTISVFAGAKKRIGESHFYYGGIAHLTSLLSKSSVHKEKIISPSFEKFIDGSKERNIPNGKISDFALFTIMPEFLFGYDFSLGLGIYSNIQINLGLPLMSTTSNDDWREWKFGLTYSIMKSF